jgi:hypothetical protein
MTVVVDEEARKGREELCLLEGLNLRKVEVAPRNRHVAASYARAANSGMSYVPRVRRKPPTQSSA